MKLRYRIIGILLLIGIYFGYREDPGEQYVMVYPVYEDSRPPFPVKLKEMNWQRCNRGQVNVDYAEIIMGWTGAHNHWFVPADIESAEKIEAYRESR